MYCSVVSQTILCLFHGFGYPLQHVHKIISFQSASEAMKWLKSAMLLYVTQPTANGLTCSTVLAGALQHGNNCSVWATCNRVWEYASAKMNKNKSPVNLREFSSTLLFVRTYYPAAPFRTLLLKGVFLKLLGGCVVR